MGNLLQINQFLVKLSILKQLTTAKLNNRQSVLSKLSNTVLKMKA